MVAFLCLICPSSKMLQIQWLLTSVYTPIAGILALPECVNILIYNSFREMGFFVSEIFVHNVWFKMIVVSNVKIIRASHC